MSVFTVEERFRELFGGALDPSSAVLQVAAVCKHADKGLFVLRIRPDSPKSEADFFSLSLARARADAIVTSGRILREEPDLRHQLPEALADWRRSELGRPGPAISAVLTSGRDLDLDHPLLLESENPLIFTSLEATARLASGAARRDIELVGSDAPNLAGLIDFLQRDKRAQTLSLEAGPSTVLPLYKLRPTRIDELLLSTFHGEVPAELLGAPFLQEDDLGRLFSQHTDETSIDEPSGRWTFQRYLRN